MLLTKSTVPVIGWVSSLLGYLMEGIFFVLDKIGIPNIGLAIIIFTIIIYMFMTPLTYKQQKFSKLQNRMSPELQAIQAKYKNRKDNESMMAMQNETSAVYAKYGVSPTGSCLQLLIQMPILFGLYQVIYRMPAYVGKIKEAFFPLVTSLIAKTGSEDLLKTFTNASMYANQFSNEKFTVENTYVDILNRASTADWATLSSTYPDLADQVSNSVTLLERYNSFLGLNIGNTPSFIVKNAFANGQYLLCVGAIMIPLLSALTQWINYKLMPQANQKTGNEQADQMASQMKIMNTTMPLISAWFCFTLPAGMGIYWIGSAVVRTFQQIVINRKIDQMDFDAIIEANKEKAAKKMEKQGLASARLAEYANIKNANKPVRTMADKAAVSGSEASDKVNNMASTTSVVSLSDEEKEEKIRKATEYYMQNAKEGSIAAKANMVKYYNDRSAKN